MPEPLSHPFFSGATETTASLLFNDYMVLKHHISESGAYRHITLTDEMIDAMRNHNVVLAVYGSGDNLLLIHLEGKPLK